MIHELLKCELVSLSYDARAKLGIVVFPDGENCDMMGCIELFSTIDKNVDSIITVSGDKADTRYERVCGTGKWVAA